MEALELLFTKALKLGPPWMVTKVEFDEGGGIIRVFIDFPRGSVFVCPVCGKAVKAYDTTELRARLTRWHADVDATVHGWSDVWLKGDFRKWDLTEFLAYIRVPMLIVQGEDDHYGTVRQLEIAQEECNCPVEVALLPNAKHVPQREAPEVTLKAISEFIARVLENEMAGTRPAITTSR